MAAYGSVAMRVVSRRLYIFKAEGSQWKPTSCRPAEVPGVRVKLEPSSLRTGASDTLHSLKARTMF